MPANIIKSFAKKTGKSEKEVEQTYNKAKKEASHMGRSKNYTYIVDILKTMLGIKEDVDIERITKMFIESDENFDDFCETVTAGSLEGGELPDTLRYVQRKQQDEEDEDEEGKEYDIVTASSETIKKLEVSKNYK